MRYSLELLDGAQGVNRLREGLAGARPAGVLPTGFQGVLSPARFIAGEDLIPDYGRKNLTAPFEIDTTDIELIELPKAIVAGRRFIVAGTQAAIFNSFSGPEFRPPDKCSEPAIDMDAEGRAWLDTDIVPMERLQGRYLLAYWDAGYMYHHWLFQCLSRLVVAADDPRFTDVRFLLPAGIGRFAAQTMQFLGISPDRLVYYDPQLLYEVESLIIYPVPHFERDRCEVGPLKYLRQRTLLRLGALPAKTTPKKIVFTRRDALDNERQLLTEQALIEKLAFKGYTAITPGEYSFEGQVRLAHQATRIVCIHGSAGANLLFCNPAARVLHLFPDSVYFFHTHGLATAIAGADYGYAFGPSFARGTRAHNNAWLLAPERLTEGLKRLG